MAKNDPPWESEDHKKASEELRKLPSVFSTSLKNVRDLEKERDEYRETKK